MSETKAANVLNLARSRSMRISTAESCTGGMISAALTAIAGSSDVFDAGFVTYSNDAKMSMLGVKADTLAAHGAVSEEVAVEMAQGAIVRSMADIAVSVTGIAGPGASQFKPEGRVCFALAQKTGATNSLTCEFGAIGRDQVRNMALQWALKLLADALNDA